MVVFLLDQKLFSLFLQKAMLLQQSSWQNNMRMGDLVEQVRCAPFVFFLSLDFKSVMIINIVILQIRSSLSSVRTLSQMLSVHVRKGEVGMVMATKDHSRVIFGPILDYHKCSL